MTAPYKTTNLLLEFKQLFSLSSFLFLSGLPLASITLLDSMVCGRESTQSLAALGAASVFWIPWSSLVQGILANLTPMIARIKGRSDGEVRALFWQGIWLSLFLGCTTTLLFPLQYRFIALITDSETIRSKAVVYLEQLRWSCPSFCLFLALKAVSDGHAETRPSIFVGLLGLAIKALLSLDAMFHLTGFVGNGIRGCALASTFVYAVMALTLLMVFLGSSPRHYAQGTLLKPLKPDPKKLLQLCLLGCTNGAAALIECIAFTAIPIFLLQAGEKLEASVHQILSSYTYWFYLTYSSIGAATTIRVSTLLGEKQQEKNRTQAKCCGFTLGCGFAVLNALVLVTLGERLTQSFSEDALLLEKVQQALWVCALYQLPDALQFIASSILRSYQELFPILLITFFSYLVISLPLGGYMALKHSLFSSPLGAFGFWIGLLLGVWFAALLSLATLYRKELHRPSSDWIEQEGCNRFSEKKFRSNSEASSPPEPGRSRIRPILSS